MSDVDAYQNAQEAVAQMAEERARVESERLAAELAKPASKNTANLRRRTEMIPLRQIQPIRNIRTELPDIHELALSIKEKGLISPLEVRQIEDEEKPYQVFAGRRRYEALWLLDPSGEMEVRCEVVEDLDDEAEVYELLFTENAQRRDFTPKEYAQGFRLLLVKNPDWTAAQLARSLGGDYTAQMIRKHLKLLKLPGAVQTMVDRGDLSFAAAELLERGQSKGKLTEEEVTELAEGAAAGEVSTSEIREQVSDPKPNKGTIPPKPENYEEISAQLDAARWGKNDYEAGSRYGSSSAHNDTFDDEIIEEGEAVPGQASADVNLPAPWQSGLPVASPKGERVISRPQRQFGTRQLHSYLLGRLCQDASPEFLEEHGIATEAIYEHVWQLAEHERAELLNAVALEMMRGDQNLPQVIFSAGSA